VRAEATTADRRGTLVPVMIEPCTRPIMFELTHTAELSRWKGDLDDPPWRAFVGDLRRFIGTAAPVDAAGASTPRPRRHVAILAGILLLAAAGAAWLLLNHAGRTAGEEPGVPSGPVTLAVLPFVNLSADPAQEYFSDGLTEELLNQLAGIAGLRVTGRTSSFSFKGRNEDLRSIAQQLGVANLLEGSVRRDGQKLRITAQLIDGRDGAHRWSRSYDREQSGIFAVQDEIARDVARALSVTLDVGPLNRAGGGTTNVEAYDRYLRLRELGLADDQRLAAFRQRAQLAREAVTLDPQFVIAWGELGMALTVLAGAADGDQAAQLRAEAGEAYDRVQALAPGSWVALEKRVNDLMREGKLAEAESAARQILKTGPLTHELAYPLINVLFAQGRLAETIELASQVQAREPLAMFTSRDQQYNFFAARRFEESEAEYQRSRTLQGNHDGPDALAFIRLLGSGNAEPGLLRARYQAAMKAGGYRNSSVMPALGPLLQDRRAMLEVLHKAYDGGAEDEMVLLADALGDEDLVLAVMRKAVLEDTAAYRFWALWLAPYSDVRADPRFRQLLREAGLVDYWRASGNWSDFCHPVPQTDDFECR
jgi:TolB-like protein/tetratricopeptide (TPR) repeat protein